MHFDPNVTQKLSDAAFKVALQKQALKIYSNKWNLSPHDMRI
jgi:hypothetical protein